MAEPWEVDSSKTFFANCKNVLEPFAKMLCSIFANVLSVKRKMVTCKVKYQNMFTTFLQIFYFRCNHGLTSNWSPVVCLHKLSIDDDCCDVSWRLFAGQATVTDIVAGSLE